MTDSNENGTDTVLAKSALRAVQWLGCAGADQLVLLGLGDQGTSQSKNNFALTPQSRETALQLVRVYRSVYAAVGGSQAQGQVWMSSHNEALGKIPSHLLTTSEGREQLLSYLAQRGGIV